MQVGPRIFANSKGELLALLHDMSGDIPERPDATDVWVVDLAPDALKGREIDVIDPITRTITLKDIPPYETEEQKRIRELEDVLLLQAENEIGGIL